MDGSRNRRHNLATPLAETKLQCHFEHNLIVRQEDAIGLYPPNHILQFARRIFTYLQTRLHCGTRTSHARSGHCACTHLRDNRGGSRALRRVRQHGLLKC